MKIIITGACGHIGSYLVSNIHRIKRVKEIFLIDNFHSKKYWPIFNLKNKPKFTFHQLDISENNSLNIFKKIDLVIHCASYTNAENSFSIKKEMYRNNINCMKNVINFCIKKKAKLFHLSSTSVYGKQVKIVWLVSTSFSLFFTLPKMGVISQRGHNLGHLENRMKEE